MRNLIVKYLIGSLILLVGFVSLQPENSSDLIKNADAKLEGREQTLLDSDPPTNAKVALLTSDGSGLAFTDETGAISLKDIETDKTIWRHSDLQNQIVKGISISESGKVLASFGKNAITVWKVESGQVSLAIPLEQTSSELVQIKLSPYGNYIVGKSKNNDINLWKLAVGGSKKIHLSQGLNVERLDFSPDGSLLVSTVGKENGSKILLWNTVNGALYKQLESNADTADIAFSSDSKEMAVAEKSGQLKFFNVSTGTIKSIIPTKQELTAIAFSPDNAYIACGAKGDKAKIQLWDPTSGKLIFSHSTEGTAEVDDLFFSSNGSLLAGIIADKQISILKVPGGELQQLFSATTNSITDAEFNAKLNAFASIGDDGKFQAWDLSTGSVKQGYQIKLVGNYGLTDLQAQLSNNSKLPDNSKSLQPATNINANKNTKSSTFESEDNVTKKGKINKFKKRSARKWKGIHALAINADGSEMGAGSADGSIQIFNKSGKKRWKMKGHHGRAITGMGFRSKAKQWVTVGVDTEIKVWDDQTGNNVKTFYGPEHPPRAVAVSPDGKFIAVAGEDTRVFIYDAVASKLSKVLAGHKDFVNGLAFSPDGNTLASAGSEGQVLLWDVLTGKLKQTMLGHTDEVNAVAISPDGGLMASASADATIILWNLTTGLKVNVLKGHQSGIRSVAFSPNGKNLVSTDDDGQMLVWNPAAGQLRKKLTKSPATVNTLAFDPKGNLHSASENGEISEFDIGNGTKVETITVPIPDSIEPQSSLSDSPIFLSRPSSESTFLSNINLTLNVEKINQNSTVLNGFVERILEWIIPAANAAIPPAPGGPILIITSASSTPPNFGAYYSEILRTEGFNEFAVADIGAVSAATLNAYDVVILAPTAALTGTQVTMFSNWVNAGGNLIAMRPSSTLASLLGITAAGSTLSEGYLLVNTSSPPGKGIVNQVIQFHGIADRYTLSGASSLATLYSNFTTPTSNPAVTLRTVGSGKAAAFTYDLATSIVYTRQGNPDWHESFSPWLAQERDGLSPKRSDDKFFGGASPDYVDLTNEVSVPQADEQQRFLGNLIINMNLSRKPLPKFWYFPRGKKAVVIMTGDDHSNNGTAPAFEYFLSQDPAGGCSLTQLADWECVRGTSYIYPSTPLVPSEATRYSNLGFEVGLHINTSCGDYTPASLEADYIDQIGQFATKYPGLALKTQRHHCIAWSDWMTGATVQLAHGMRLDTSYYFWPPGWVQDRPGFFTGSAMPMRFSGMDGSLVDVYEAVTHMTDESGQSYPATIDTLLDRASDNTAVGKGYYGAYTANLHTDYPVATADKIAVVTSAKARGVPVISAAQMLTWLDGRNTSSFGSMTWSANVLNFTVTAGSGSRGLIGMLPLNSATGVITGITYSPSGGSSAPLAYTLDTIKGVQYALFAANTGTYTASYGVDSIPPAVAANTPANGATGINQLTTITATFSEPIDPTTINTTTYQLKAGSSPAVPAIVNYDPSTKKATLTPTSLLAGSAVYTATVSTGVKDVAGNSLAAPFVWSFTTEATPCSSSPCSAWNNTTLPGTPVVNDPSSVELGVKFRAELPGYITGVRFYQANTGTYQATLWSLTGQQLATGSVTSTAGGWQQVNFPTPVAITANTVYVASYHAPNGNYAANGPSLLTAGVDIPPIHLLQDGISGSNGVYQYSANTTFPTNSFQGSNYWVDVAFTTNIGPDTTAPTITSQNPTAGATGIPVNSPLIATFSEPMDAATILGTTFELRNTANSTVVTATVSYDSATRTATLTPSASLTASTQYTASIKGGTVDPRVKDLAGNALVANYTWNFTTAASGGTTGCSGGTSSILPNNPNPAPPSEENDNSSVELGVKFRASQNGYICGIRFYKGINNTGTHVGKLWSSTGTLLASANFQNETASGWQQVSFTNPVQINAGTTYVASYLAPVGHYSANNNYFDAGLTSGSLYAYSSAESGGNGVYQYGAGGFPNSTYLASNYWVDVTFTTSLGPDTTPPTVNSTLPVSAATGVVPTSPVTVTFNEPMAASSITSTTFELHTGTATGPLVAASVSYNPATNTATLTPSSAMAASTQYTAKVIGGAAGVKDSATPANPLAADYTWSFTTGVNPCSVGGNPIVCENSKIGNPASEWDVGGGSTTIEGFATDISVNRGGTVQFKVKSSLTNYHLDIYRMGYYNGLGARKVATLAAHAGPSQPTCYYHTATGLTDCDNWAVTDTWNGLVQPQYEPSGVATIATSGIYFAKATIDSGASAGQASHIFFIVRDDVGSSDILFQTSDTTWQAYNNWGDSHNNSFYQGTGPGTGGSSNGRAYKLSYNRPFNTRNVDSGQDWVFNAEYPMVRWLEANGYNVSYSTGVDSDRFGSLIRNHKMFISNAHDEYWSGQQRTNVEAARDAGTNPVNLAFFSGNEVFWKTRWENNIINSSGTSGINTHRTLVCYKETHAGAKIDPLPNVWTGTWRDPRFSPPADGGRPENALMGPIFTVNDGATTNITVPEADGKMRFWRNTSIAALAANTSATLPGSTLGYEWDEDLDNGFRPAGLVRLSTTIVAGAPVLVDYGSTFGSGTANHALTLYKAASGAKVFGAGTVQWAWGLDGNHDRGSNPPSLAMQQATINLFADMEVQPSTIQSGLVPATQSTDVTRPTSAISSPIAGSTVPLNVLQVISGTASDIGGRVGGVEVSVNGGVTWHPANGRISWTYNWTPSANGSVNIKVRAVDDSLNLELPSTGINVIVGTGSDGTPPTVAMTAPANGTTVTGSAVAVSATASDNVGVTSVQFLLDGVALGSPDTAAPYSITWNSTTATNGTHTLSARASDAAGNNTTSTGVSVTVSNGVITNTGLLSPTANAAVTTSAGDNNGFQTTATNAYADGGGVAVDTNSGNTTSTSCTNAGKDKHIYRNYNVNIPAGAAIKGIEVRLDARVDATLLVAASQMCVQISWDGGTSWTATQATANLTTTEASYILGSGTNTWGRTWAVSEFSNTNFLVRIINNSSNTARDFSLDWAAVRVTYQ
jgi:WD40 repeat protein